MMEDYNKGSVSCGVCEKDFLISKDLLDHFKKEHMNNCSGEKSRMLVAEETFVNLYDADEISIKIEKEAYYDPSQANPISISPINDDKQIKTENYVLIKEAVMTSNIIKEEKDIDSLLSSSNETGINETSGCDASGTAAVKIENEESSKMKPFHCHLCGTTFADKSVFERHLRTHPNEKQFICRLCDFKSIHESHFERHTRIHTGEKPFACHLCDYECSQKGNLKRHIMMHTGEKLFACHLCDFKCNHKNHMKNHIRTHTGEKPFACHLCDYKCSQNSHLKNHIRTHTGEKPFACHLCEYKCRQNVHLKKHLKKHTGKHRCEINLKEHIRKHTVEEPFKQDEKNQVAWDLSWNALPLPL